MNALSLLVLTSTAVYYVSVVQVMVQVEVYNESVAEDIENATLLFSCLPESTQQSLLSRFLVKINKMKSELVTTEIEIHTKVEITVI
jgi:hypothetical protein